MSITSEQVFSFVSEHGPVTAEKTGGDLGSDSFLASALLSELKEAKRIRATSPRFGVAYYYLANQSIEELATKLGSGDKKAYDYIKEHQVVREDELEPAMRMRLGEIVDFVKTVPIKMGEAMHKFFVYYTLSEEEVVAVLKKRYVPRKQPKKESQKVVQEQAQEKIVQPSSVVSTSPKGIGPVSNVMDMRRALENIGCVVESYLEIKKSSEADAIVKIPTALSMQKYFVKLRFKKKVQEGDLSSAYLQALTKQLPLCFLTNGELTKKASEMLKNELKGVLFFSA